LSDSLKNWRIPPPPETPSPNQLDQWFSSALCALTTTIETTAPRSRPSPRSKAGWTPLLTTLQKEFTKATQRAKKIQTPESYNLTRQSKLGYFKAIKKAKASYWADFLEKTSPNTIWTDKQLVAARKTPRFPSLAYASSPVAINNALLDHFSPPKDPLPDRGRLRKNPSAAPLTREEIKLALSKSSPPSAPGPDGIPYSVWKRFNLVNPAILLELLAPLVSSGYHPPSLKTPNGVVLDKPGKASYDSPASFRIIVLLKTVSRILERVMTVRLSAITRSKGLLHPNQSGSLPGLSSSDACLTLMHEVKTLKRPRLEVSTLFLDIKAGFDNVNASTLRARLSACHVPSYMVDWVSSFLSVRTCTLVFQGSPNVSSPVSVGTPRGPPSPLFSSYSTSPPCTCLYPVASWSPTLMTSQSPWPPPPTEATYTPTKSLLLHGRKRPGYLRLLLGPKNRTHPVANPEPADTPLACPDRARRPPLPSLPSGQMAGLLVEPLLQHGPPLQGQAFAGPGNLLLHQAPLLPGGGHQTFPLPPHRQWPPPTHTDLQGRPPRPKLYSTQRHE